jgi:hypothetical protein
MRDFMVLLRRDRYNNNREIKQGNYFFYRIVYDCFSFYLSPLYLFFLIILAPLYKWHN